MDIKVGFGNKGTFVKTGTGVLGAMSYLKIYERYTLGSAIKHVKNLTEKSFKNAKVDRGYRGKNKIIETVIIVPSTTKKSLGY
ncbi:MAG: hypothetical protein U5K51_11530 [Flavobacteriaceae bacterium]|nr:hypothetical protein [Flavobacteriaceae bacterium]